MKFRKLAIEENSLFRLQVIRYKFVEKLAIFTVTICRQRLREIKIIVLAFTAVTETQNR